ncbi:MAG: magnesium transporter [Campylobacterota bacterium]|nr:magnesium transporter [Campylobacterota bacterium]
MVSFYLVMDQKLKIIKEVAFFEANEELKENVVWIDMLFPSVEEKQSVEKLFDVVFPTKQESEEIEISSRYWEESNKIEINSYFLLSGEHAKNETVSFILQSNKLISVRYSEFKTFDEMRKKFLASPKDLIYGYDVFCSLLDIRIDVDADIIEKLSRDITQLRKFVFTDYKNDDEEVLEKISAYEDLNMKIRENLTDKQRILTAFLKSNKLKENLKNDVIVMLKDIKSLVDYTEFNFERLDYLQNIFVGVLSIEQNKVIKMFTIVNVVFLPPTLIASIYGMNFDFLPELHWKYGYVFSILLMVGSATLPLYIFKKKGWF